MNVILLSGGTGKRLWPLSNEVRSKQFIKVFKSPDGSRESMVQRMYRKIKEIDKNAVITIATSESQVAEIQNQLGEGVAMSIEPMRRDTFPAIAIASVYLSEIKHVSADDAVIVCSVDPYVDDDFFMALETMEKAVKEGAANLTLLGKEPSFPSEKFGYILPCSKRSISRVTGFKEKPDAETAEKFIKEGALWNMGVFGFKLKYLLEKAHETIDFSDYHDFLKRYGDSPRISFDYAIAEKETSIQVIRFAGQWNDLGTWEAFAEAISERAFGPSFMKECVNSRIVNETDMPIVGIGLDGILVAASVDGILVSTVARSQEIKPIVETMNLGSPRYAEESWGEFRILDSNAQSRTICFEMRAGSKMGREIPANCFKTWTVVSGTGFLMIGNERRNLRPGEILQIVPNSVYSVEALTKLKIIEVEIGALN